jgi:DNA-binding response OmpR family regulator
MAPTRTVLVVDDDSEILTALRTVLEKRGYRVLTATDGNQGLAAAEREAPDLVVVDMMMPKKSGFLVLEKLKSRPSGPAVIMITANEGSRHRAYASALGADDYLRKPFDMSRFLESVERLCPLEPALRGPLAPGSFAQSSGSFGQTSGSPDQARSESHGRNPSQ